MSQSFLIYKDRCFLQKFETTYFSLGEIQGFFDSIYENHMSKRKAVELGF